MLHSLTPRRTDGFLPLEHYAALGDGRSVALVGADGSIDWWCAPDMDSVPLFNRLHDPEGGHFTVTPTAPFWIERRYRDKSNVLETVFVTDTGSARVTESLNSGEAGRLPWCELARRIERLLGTVEFKIVLKPICARGEVRKAKHANADVRYIGNLATTFCHGDDVEVVADEVDRTIARLVTSAGSRSCVALLVADRAPLAVPELERIDRRIDLSDEEWRRWAEHLTYDGPFKEDLVRCALSLKFLLFSKTGAIAAAATSSLPERIGGDKNYDYRYAWIRDAAYTIKALLRAGALSEPIGAFGWLVRTIRQDGPEPKVVYTLGGDTVPPEEVIDVAGYRGSSPVRVGNRARLQVQLSCYGDILETAALFVEMGHVIDPAAAELLEDLAEQCMERWMQEDSSIWELEDRQHYTFSKIGCWLALSNAAELARNGHIAGDAERWEKESERIRDWIDEHCWSKAKHSYTFYAGTERLDARFC
jgi:GH15 family glucan-1,4-alpha-glucosidase